MARLTDDPTDPDLTRGGDDTPREQSKAYLVLSAEERAKGFIKPVRDRYQHEAPCGTVTTMSREIAETYARDPWLYGTTYCVGCKMHRPLSEFRWLDGEPMDVHHPDWGVPGSQGAGGAGAAGSDTRLMDRYTSGKTPKEIARRLARQYRVIQMRASGMTYEQIGAAEGVTRERVTQIIRKRYLPAAG